MGSQVGKLAKVVLGTDVVAGQGTWEIGGIVNDTIEDTAFGTTIKVFVFGMQDPGTVSYSGNFDPDDADGQVALITAARAQTELTDLYFYVNATQFWSVDVGGAILLTSAPRISIDKNGLGQISFEGKVSGKTMVQLPAA